MNKLPYIVLLLFCWQVHQANADFYDIINWLESTWPSVQKARTKVLNRQTKKASFTSSNYQIENDRNGVGEHNSLVACGISKYNSELSEGITLRNGATFRISDGRTARQNEAPWQVRIVVYGDEQCGGTVLNSRTVITAGHCILTQDTRQYKLYLADHHVTEKDPGEQVVGVSKIVVHPDFDGLITYEFDFALLITSDVISFNENDKTSPMYVRPVCLPPPGSYLNELAGLGVTIGGWGFYDSAEIYTADVLQMAHVRIMNHYVCKSRWREIKDITKNMLCAGYDNADSYVDTCQGDSGGGMTTVRHGRYTLIGITSFGVECNNMNKIPGVYARLTSALSWIQENAIGALYYS